MKKNILTIFSLMVVMSVAYGLFEINVPVQRVNRQIEVEIPKGASFRQAAEILLRENLIRDKRIFMIMGRLTGADRKIRAGYYEIWTGMSPLDIFRIIRAGKIIEYEIKVLEGDSLLEISDAFSRIRMMNREEFMQLSRDREFLVSHGIKAPSIEGYIFPDTYTIPKGMSVRDALDIMIAKMREKFSEKLREKANAAGMTEAEVLTLASIIEKEAVADSERQVIAAVYHNRLKKNMPLQADPTAIYGVKSSKEKITKEDLRRKTPYNTYIQRGLPPGPIASPGLKSIEAAVSPAKLPYLYFVSNNDGTHNFSVTLREHEENVRQYRDKKRAGG